jgi:serine/threonine-protein kinase
LLRGIDLRGLVERYGPVPAERAIYILRQACHSLHDAHLTGVVHRDVKPGNIFVCRVGPDYDFVKVLDFGLVKHVGEPGAKAADQLTVEGTTSATTRGPSTGARTSTRSGAWRTGSSRVSSCSWANRRWPRC